MFGQIYDDDPLIPTRPPCRFAALWYPPPPGASKQILARPIPHVRTYKTTNNLLPSCHVNVWIEDDEKLTLRYVRVSLSGAACTRLLIEVGRGVPPGGGDTDGDTPAPPCPPVKYNDALIPHETSTSEEAFWDAIFETSPVPFMTIPALGIDSTSARHPVSDTSYVVAYGKWALSVLAICGKGSAIEIHDHMDYEEKSQSLVDLRFSPHNVFELVVLRSDDLLLIFDLGAQGLARQINLKTQSFVQIKRRGLDGVLTASNRVIESRLKSEVDYAEAMFTAVEYHWTKGMFLVVGQKIWEFDEKDGTLTTLFPLLENKAAERSLRRYSDEPNLEDFGFVDICSHPTELSVSAVISATTHTVFLFDFRLKGLMQPLVAVPMMDNYEAAALQARCLWLPPRPSVVALPIEEPQELPTPEECAEEAEWSDDEDMESDDEEEPQARQVSLETLYICASTTYETKLTSTYQVVQIPAVFIKRPVSHWRDFRLSDADYNKNTTAMDLETPYRFCLHEFAEFSKHPHLVPGLLRGLGDPGLQAYWRNSLARHTMSHILDAGPVAGTIQAEVAAAIASGDIAQDGSKHLIDVEKNQAWLKAGHRIALQLAPDNEPKQKHYGILANFDNVTQLPPEADPELEQSLPFAPHPICSCGVQHTAASFPNLFEKQTNNSVRSALIALYEQAGFASQEGCSRVPGMCALTQRKQSDKMTSQALKPELYKTDPFSSLGVPINDSLVELLESKWPELPVQDDNDHEAQEVPDHIVRRRWRLVPDSLDSGSEDGYQF
eukprot:Blabericola_migrator_1__12480@NODE_789_length_6495_cov_79_169104_g558_i0_p2_GENE_NODE_789_length_6495_cov_79_169104_g558_i0NODE_789_length_6495_cov_79_169104_g558_i0_p2_ORF_typecomplete_len779_score119_77GNTI/PF03071_15/0_24_NODE_789_length_6495_cov_79_169104_g558_i012553591